MKQDFFYPGSDGETQIHAVEWLPEGAPRATLQLCHGMAEHIGRYDAFASFLAGHGFYVTGCDLPGHGQSVTSPERLGYFRHPAGNECVVAAIHALRERTDARYPALPRFLLGHSMGGFLLRQYLGLHGEGLAGAVVLGGGFQPALSLTAGKALCRAVAALRGWTYRSRLVDSIATGDFNKRFEPARTPCDWLTRDEAAVDAYIADPLCGFMFTVNAFYHMFRGMEAAQSPKTVEKIPKSLPLLLASGEEDPIGGFGSGIRRVFDDYRAAGLSETALRLYPGARHELLNERNREAVYADLLAWLTARI